MNMHGFMTPADPTEDRELTLSERVRNLVYARRWFFLIVVLPTVLVGLYLYLYAANQYESEAHFLVHSAEKTQIPSAGASALSMLTGVGLVPNRRLSTSTPGRWKRSTSRSSLRSFATASCEVR